MVDASPASIARNYIEAVGRRDLDPLDTLFDDDLVVTLAGSTSDKAEWIEALRRLLPILIRNDIRDVFEVGDRACVVYDFVTDTEAGAVSCVEVMTVREGRIIENELVFDRVTFAPVQAALANR
jgi:ketosteroid isomerase-like protein